MTKISVAFASLLSAMSAYAVDTTLEVHGSIEAGTCTLTVQNGLIYDFGDITLNDSGITTLPNKPVPFTIECPQPTLAAIHIQDNRVNTIKTDRADTGRWRPMGLGVDRAGNNIGAYVLSVDAYLQNFAPSNLTALKYSLNNGQTWGAPGAAEGYNNNVWLSFGLGSTSSTTVHPIERATLNATLIRTDVAPKVDVDSSRGFNLDGSFSLTIVYM